MHLAVAGGTGVVGKYVVEAAEERGHDVVVLSRSRGVDLTTGEGLNLRGVEGVIDCSNVLTMSAKKSVAFFEAASGHLLDAAEAAGVRHHVVLSIVGVDRVKFGYYEGKVAQERLALAGPVPATVLRATQFHEFAGQLLDRIGGPLAAVPRMRTQPVSAAEVGEHLVELVEGRPLGMAPELAGPEVLEMSELARRVSAARGDRRKVVGVRIPGAGGRQMASGELLPQADGPRGKTRFSDWLAAQE